MKRIGTCYWVHKTATNQFDLSIRERLDEVLKLRDFDYDVVRYDKKNNSISLIKVEDWDNQLEPVLRYSIKINSDNTISKRCESLTNPLIYHSKELFVNTDYTGFDIEKAKLRSLEWKALKLDSKKIGRYLYWTESLYNAGLIYSKKES